MSDIDAVGEARARRISPLIRGLLLLFDRREGPSYCASAGLRLLAIVVVLELLIGPRAHILEILDLPQPQAWLRIGTLLLEALVAVRLWANVRLSDVGFLSPGKWTAAEQIFFVQILIGGVIAISLRGFTLPHSSAGEPVWIAAVVLFGPQILWGFYQEVIYRGLLQT